MKTSPSEEIGRVERVQGRKTRRKESAFTVGEFGTKSMRSVRWTGLSCASGVGLTTDSVIVDVVE
jgi:hypothetical protein